VSSRTKRNAQPAPSEHDIQTAILDYLIVRRIFHYRQNSGAFKKGSHFVRFGYPGAPDIVCVIGGRYIGLEIKDRYGEQSAAQVAFQTALERAGGRYFVVRSLEDAISALGK
jgi:hypothetical protein